MTPTDLADLIRHRREVFGVSIEHLAQLAGVETSTAANWCRGRNLRVMAGLLTALEAVGVELRAKPIPKRTP